MAASKFENLWKMMSEYSLASACEIPDSVLCRLCQKIMVDPYITECGCQFCFNCIQTSMKRGMVHCPGDKEGCAEEVLELDANVVRDIKTRHDITHVIFKCPNDFCSLEFELKKMEEHIRICQINSIDCPFKEIGCGDEKIPGHDINEHLSSEVLFHSQLLIETINHWRNDVGRLNQLELSKDREIKRLKEENKNVLKKLNDFINESQRDDVAFKEEFHRIKLELEKLERALKSPEANDILKELERKSKRYSDSSEKEDLGRRTSNIGIGVNVNSQISKQQNEINSLKDENMKLSDEIEGIRNCMREMNLLHDFLWTIYDFSKKKNQFYESNPFFKDNYKVCLRAWIDGYNIHLYLCILKSERDDLAKWPMKHTIILGILNQGTMKTSSSASFCWDRHAGNKSVFMRPVEHRNEHIGGMKIPRNDIQRLLSSDSLIVCCSLVRPSV